MTERIQSYTQPGVFYDLTIKSGLAINCTCPDCVRRERVCKHMEDYNNAVVAARMAAMQTLAQNVLMHYRSGVLEPEGARTLETFLGSHQPQRMALVCQRFRLICCHRASTCQRFLLTR